MKKGKEYAIARGLICILVFAGTYLMMINEEISMKLIGASLLSVVALLSGILTTPLSKKMISVGDSLEKKVLQGLYYFVLLILSFVIVGLSWMVIYVVYSRLPQSSDFSTSLGEALVVVFWYAVTCVLILMPYLQTIIVLLIRRFTGRMNLEK